MADTITRERADSIFFNGKIVTLDSTNTIASAVAVKNGRIIAVGFDEMMRRVSADHLIDLKGKTMLPGFVDSHCHLGLAVRSFLYYVDCRCPPNKSIPDILDRIRQKVRETPEGEWIVGHASTFGKLKLAEKRYPTKEELDLVAAEHPVALHFGLHTAIVNTYALKLAHITRKDAEALGEKRIERDHITGEPTGVLTECRQMLRIPTLTLKELKDVLRTGVREYWVKQGFTTACSFGDALELRAYQELLNEGSLPLRIRAMVRETDDRADSLESLIQLGILPGLGDNWLRIGGIKIFVDGAFMGLSAATREPYLNLPDRNYFGILRLDSRTLNELVLKAHNAGLQLCIHAMGDKGQDLALSAYENALKLNPRYHRHRIEHFGCDMGSPELRRRAKVLGIIPITTIGWLYAYGDFIERYLGAQRKTQSFALRSMIDEGLEPANASDQCGTEPITSNPFFSIWCAVTRQTFSGSRFVPEEAISVNEALRLWTMNGGYAGFEEKLKGSIEPGKLADMIVISRDILTIPEDQIKDVCVEMTILDGKIVFKI